ncbi:hypothetical protein M407DRAFT_241984 [Tulasnella calospora MUT 4182]|uniref:Uncharacterized protein n=1 Tax=Tulasnella calospora MUT 4182 TaxID=1051891 RepID=A0A0C3LB54_9AGAM|nr:hypothetical protein M407DRAFT_241984 [Tulasnella calospora MUT 4182]
MPEATVKDEEPVNSTQPSQLKIGTDVYTIPVTASLAGGLLGFIRGSRMSSLRFLAENAHRAPTTVRGWYFYNKTKNYRVLLGGFKGGGQEALRLGAVGCGWVAFEEGWKAISTQVLGVPQLSAAKEVVAGGGTASAICVIYRLPRRTAVQTIGLGLAVGAAVSLLRKGKELLVERRGKDDEGHADKTG